MKLSANSIKWIAIIGMFSDHIARTLYAVGALSLAGTLPIAAFIMLIVGKITAPVMFYFITVGFSKTRNVAKYLMRLGIFALLSHIPYNLFINNVSDRGEIQGNGFIQQVFSNVTFAPTSVIFTLFLAVVALVIYESKWDYTIKVFSIVAIILISGIGDWGFVGVILALIFHIFQDKQKIQWFLYFVSMAAFAFILYFESGNWTMIATIVIGSVLPFIVLCFYNGERGRGGRLNKWAFYIIYPLHLFILWSLFVLVSANV